MLAVMKATGQLYGFRIQIDIHHRVTENTETSFFSVCREMTAYEKNGPLLLLFIAGAQKDNATRPPMISRTRAIHFMILCD